MNATATVTFYNRARGWGFAAPHTPGHDVFLHASNLPLEHKYLNEGDVIEYEPGLRDGRPLALKIKILEEAPILEVAS